MSFDNERDPREVLARDKHFTMHPKPLERWLWAQKLPQSAERVYWVHWEAGQRQGDWCSEMSLREVARECGLDQSTVTRAYQHLKALGLIRREEPGRDPGNPFRQEVAITEVLVPRELVVCLARFPDRAPAKAVVVHPESVTPAASTPAAYTAPARPNRDASKAAFAKMSARERSEYHTATQNRTVSMAFDSTTGLSPEERGQILDMLTRIAATRPAPAAVGSRPTVYPPAPRQRQLTPLVAARVRAAVATVAPTSEATELFRQVLWSMEQGALTKHHPSLALNIALKKIREGAWTRPNRLPSAWLSRARPETCGVA